MKSSSAGGQYSAMQPLYVDTSSEYDLDMSRFPGWDNLTIRYQPTLMIHQTNCPCSCAVYTESIDEDILNDTIFETNDRELDAVIDTMATTLTESLSSLPVLSLTDDLDSLETVSSHKPRLSACDSCNPVEQTVNHYSRDCVIESRKRKICCTKDESPSQRQKKALCQFDEYFNFLNLNFCSPESDTPSSRKSEDMCRGS